MTHIEAVDDLQLISGSVVLSVSHPTFEGVLVSRGGDRLLIVVEGVGLGLDLSAAQRAALCRLLAGESGSRLN